MNVRTSIWLLCVLLSAGVAFGQGYVDLTCYETSLIGDHIIAYESGDTMDWTVRSDREIGMSGSPVFYAPVITAASSFWHWIAYDPHFYGGEPQYNAATIWLPSTAQSLRNCALEQGHYFDSPGQSYHASFRGDFVKMWSWTTGEPEDSSGNWTVPISVNGTCLFVLAPLDIEGVVTGRVTIGSSCNIRIMDNLLYSDSEFPSGKPASHDPHGNMLGVVSEGDVKIANTPANGRENSNGMGEDQTDPAFRDVTIAALIAAFGGSFTFEQQNDPDSGYVCDCVPDNRGKVYLYGSFMQLRRGYIHRYLNQFTGYRAKIVFDCRMNYVAPPSFTGPGDYLSTDSLDFGDVAVGTTVTDTAEINTLCRQYLGGVSASLPFHAERVMPFQGGHFIVPTSFTPPRAGLFTGHLNVTFEEEYRDIYLRGRGVAPSAVGPSLIPHPSSLVLSASPNPFNPATTIRFEIPVPGDVSLTVFDVQGRAVERLVNSRRASGVYSVTWNASRCTSGVYFVRLESAAGVRVDKLLLMK